MLPLFPEKNSKENKNFRTIKYLSNIAKLAPLSLPPFLSLTLSMSQLLLCLFLFLSFWFYLPVSFCLSLCLYLSLYLSLCLSLNVSFCISVSLHVYVSVSLHPSLLPLFHFSGVIKERKIMNKATYIIRIIFSEINCPCTKHLINGFAWKRTLWEVLRLMHFGLPGGWAAAWTKFGGWSSWEGQGPYQLKLTYHP